MATLRSTVIVKTDICAFTPKVNTLSESELSTLLNEHKLFISGVAAKNEGTIIKGEGDAFWMIFPSVTRAALAAVEMQQELRLMQPGKGDDERLAIRVVITLGDVLHQDNDIFGDTVNLTARIESITPPDEIYLSHAAWLALNKAEIRTAFVNEYMLKGMSLPSHVYKIEQKHRTRIITDQIIVLTDVSAFTAYYKSHSIAETEHLLISLDTLTKHACEQYGGIIRVILGDAYFLTFSEAGHALAAMEQLCDQWSHFMHDNDVACGMRAGIHRGDVNIFRSFAYSEAANIAGMLEGLTVAGREPVSVLVSQDIYDAVAGSRWEQKLQCVDVASITLPPRATRRSFLQSLIEKRGIYQLIRS